MSGKAILFLVMSFSLIYLIMGRNLGDISTRAVTNSSNYYNNTLAHEIAVSGANIAASKICFNPLWVTGIPRQDFNGGKIEATVIVNGEQRTVVARGTYADVTTEVRIILSPSKFSKFAYYSGSEDGNGIIYWMSKDTVWGPFHTQDWMYVSGSPVFYGKVTTKLGVKKKVPSDSPKFLGGYDQGSLALPTDGVSKLKTNGSSSGKVFSLMSTSTARYSDFYLTFKGDSINYKYNWKEKVGSSWYDRVTNVTVKTSNISSNGVIFFEGKDKDGNIINMRLKGTVDGQYTVGTSGSVYLDDDVVYKTSPLDRSTCNDVLGIVAKNDVIITDNTPNRSSINIDASIYTETGGFTAENYDGRPPSGTINLIGGIIQAERKPVGQFNSGTQTVTSGFSKRYMYDQRLLGISPPYYPGTDKFEILSWYE